ncbi:MAG TPA: cellulase family glycosylhydrolase, partial [Armatimonadota bacterium]|nr:cellulase family glycosylhydrolase [Armatimonadota bacterium]
MFLTLAALSLPIATPSQTIRTRRLSESRVLVYDRRVELGIGMHGMPDEHLARVKALGIRLVRHTMYWAQIETTEEPGLYDADALAQWDDLVRRCNEQGIVLEVVVHQNAPGCSYENRAESYARFARFMGDMSKRYPSIRYWELWNEMDGAFTDLFGARAGIPLVERGKLYAEMLKLAAPAIRAANPNALILTGGMTDVGDFPRGIYEAGGREDFDIMNIHTYGVPVVWAFIARGLAVRDVMDEFGDHDKPLWNTEFGIDAGNLVGAWGYPHDRGKEDAETLDALHKAQWEACLNAALEQGIYQKILPYQYSAGNERNDDGEIETKTNLPDGLAIHDFGFGIVRSDGITPRPTYDWLKALQFNAWMNDEPRPTE